MALESKSLAIYRVGMKVITKLSRHVLFFLACLFCWSNHAHAWYATGHALIGQIAYDNLSKEERKAFVALLEEHPRFKKDFSGRMPDIIANSSTAQVEQWLFRQSGSWPDKARAYKGSLRRRFHEPRWHYINYPLNVRRDVRSRRTFPRTDASTALTRNMNAVQAVAAHRIIAADPKQSPADRALSLTWICHLVGDLHQPLHTTALFTDHQFPRGDRGGNSIPIVGQGSVRNLHAFWDTVIGRSVSDRIQILQARLIAERYPVEALNLPHSTNISTWANESVLLSVNVVYGDAIRTHVAANEEKRGKLAPVLISENYRAAARTVAEKRIALAGYRLSEVLADTLASELIK